VDERHRVELVNHDFSAEQEPRPEGRAEEVSADAARADRVGVGDAPTGGSVEPLVSITLSRNQIDHVIRAALGDDVGPSMSVLVAGVGFHRDHARHALSARYRSLQDNRRLSRSLLSGLLVLSCFPPEGADLGIKDISQELELNTSTVHRYVLTLVAAGLLERDPDTRRYRLLAE
jgi:IclR helix-turn-helix domain